MSLKHKLRYVYTWRTSQFLVCWRCPYLGAQWKIIGVVALAAMGVWSHLAHGGYSELQTNLHIFDRPKVKKAFHWKNSNGLIFFLWGVVIAMVALGAGLDNAAYLFKWAYFFAVAAFVWSIGSWLTSDTVQSLQKPTRRQRRGLDHYSRWKCVLVKWGVAALIVVFFLGSLDFVSDIALRKALELLEGRLVPGRPNSTKSVRRALG